MFRKILRKMPWVYGIVRKLHIIFNDIVMFPLRCKINIETKKKISNLKIIDGNRVWYLCVPVHNNLGDYAQYVCISKWIKEAFPNYNEIEIPTIPLCYDYSGLEKEMKKKIKNDDVIIFQSGYTSSDLHPDEAVHRKIAKTFLKNKIVFFPQTVKYTSEKEIKKTAKLYNDHGRILFMTRDQQSFDEAKKYFTQIKVMLYPDIVTSLIGSFHKESLDKREGIVFCIRSDSEKLYTDSLIKREFEYLQSKKLTWLDTTLEKNKQCSKDIIDEYIRTFSNHELIITDRFHGTIISLISETPVIVLKTTDHKVSEGAKWFIDVYPDYFYNANDLPSAAKKAREMLNKHDRKPMDSYFKEKYYDNLINTINIL